MNETIVIDFSGVPYVMVDKKVTNIVIIRGNEQYELTIPESKFVSVREVLEDLRPEKL